jgi:hypothetical protein
VTIHGTGRPELEPVGSAMLSYMSGDKNCHRPPAPAAAHPFSASPPRAQPDTDPHPGGQPHPQEGGFHYLPKNKCRNTCHLIENTLHKGMATRWRRVGGVVGLV